MRSIYTVWLLSPFESVGCRASETGICDHPVPTDTEDGGEHWSEGWVSGQRRDGCLVRGVGVWSEGDVWSEGVGVWSEGVGVWTEVYLVGGSGCLIRGGSGQGWVSDQRWWVSGQREKGVWLRVWSDGRCMVRGGWGYMVRGSVSYCNAFLLSVDLKEYLVFGP